MIPYYDPHLYLSTIFKSLFINNSGNKITNYFKKYTGKEYVLLTDSCRSALKLAYECIGKKGEVITSPLTCQVAIHPIIESGNCPKYIDIKKETLVMNEDLIEESISDNTIAIQAIHFGGTPCKMDIIHEIAKNNKLVLIEDCAQGYGAKYKGRNVGTWGDVACFSMMKNLYGIGGGVFATDDFSYYLKAKHILSESTSSKKLISIYRIILALVETKRDIAIFDNLYNYLKKRVKSNKADNIKIKNMNYIERKINFLQLKNSEAINKERIQVANSFLADLKKQLKIDNYIESQESYFSYTKFNLYSDCFNKHTIENLNQNGVEAKHLEHKYGVYFQDKLISDKSLVNYNNVHDKLISLPVVKVSRLNIIKTINNYRRENENNLV